MENLYNPLPFVMCACNDSLTVSSVYLIHLILCTPIEKAFAGLETSS
jgi:hypothetical protein